MANPILLGSSPFAASATIFSRFGVMLFNKNLVHTSYFSTTASTFTPIIKIFIYQKDLSDLTFLSEVLITNKLKPDTNYIVLIKVKYGNNLYAMAGDQVPFIFSSFHDLNSFTDFQDSILERLDLLNVSYNVDYFDYICLYFKEIKYNNIIKKNKSEVLSLDETNTIPRNLRLDLIKFNDIFGPDFVFKDGLKLETIIKDDVVIDVIVNLGNETFNFLDRIRKYTVKPVEFNIHNCFYLYLINDKYFIISICEGSKHLKKRVYTIKGLFKGEVIDSLLPNNILKRSISNNDFFIHDNAVSYREKLYNFNSIKSSIHKTRNRDLITANPNIGTFDIETYINKDGDSKVYALGYYTKLDKSKLFYINKDNNSDNVVLECLMSMFNAKYSETIFYCHNFGQYDAVFLLKSIFIYNSSDLGKLSPISINRPFFMNSSILKLTLSKKVGKSMRSITFVDSLPLLNDGLKSLGLKYVVDVVKGDFPHKFVNENTLFYVGPTPDLYYYGEDFDKNDYIKSEKWDLRNECLSYLKNDLVSLYQVLHIFNLGIFINFGVQMTKSMTISSIALDVYLSKYYPQEKNVIPLINNS